MGNKVKHAEAIKSKVKHVINKNVKKAVEKTSATSSLLSNLMRAPKAAKKQPAKKAAPKQHNTQASTSPPTSDPVTDLFTPPAPQSSGSMVDRLMGGAPAPGQLPLAAPAPKFGMGGGMDTLNNVMDGASVNEDDSFGGDDDEEDFSEYDQAGTDGAKKAEKPSVSETDALLAEADKAHDAEKVDEASA